MKKQLIAKKRFGKYRVGDDVHMTAGIARAFIALGFVAEPETSAPAEAALLRPRRGYKRRDIMPAVVKAEEPAPAVPVQEPEPAATTWFVPDDTDQKT